MTTTSRQRDKLNARSKVLATDTLDKYSQLHSLDQAVMAGVAEECLDPTCHTLISAYGTTDSSQREICGERTRLIPAGTMAMVPDSQTCSPCLVGPGSHAQATSEQYYLSYFGCRVRRNDRPRTFKVPSLAT